MRSINKWISDYNENVSVEKINWIKLNSSELGDFFENNYLDKKTCEYVYDENANSLFPTPLGMTYLNFDNVLDGEKYSFLLGIVNNSIGKKTVVAATIYIDEYFMFEDQEKPVTYISTMEVNSYFRNRGIYKEMCGILIKFINPNQHIITTKQSEMGAQYNVFEILKNNLIYKGFQNNIFIDNHGLINSELHDIICAKQKILKKNN